MNITPMQGRILVKEIKPEEKTKGGLILPKSAQERSLMKALVITCGAPSPEYDCSLITEGSTVLFVEYAAAEVELEGEEYRFVRYEDVIGTIA